MMRGSGWEGEPAVRVHDGKKPWAQRIRKEICAFLILSNIMVNSHLHVSVCHFVAFEHVLRSLVFQMWVIPAFGVHPQFEIGFGKQFFGFSAWFVLVNLSQPLSVFYRMHSVAALMELLLME